MKKGAVFVLGILVGVMLVAAEIAVLTWCDNNLNVATDAVEYTETTVTEAAEDAQG